jgi:hypothetical protein
MSDIEEGYFKKFAQGGEQTRGLLVYFLLFSLALPLSYSEHLLFL